MSTEAKRRPVFDIIENPEKGWVCILIRRTTSATEETVWRIEIQREADGLLVSHENPSLFVAWARATEKAYMLGADL